ncbi:hypothetical protein [Bradyrhizobium sp. WD16]|uniref:hypothetical protein n=1 Tax=Bradyrhizobium sp. WD16 TaxID=1521768 RepID=UPI0020A47673|nr:hypothetical protein [Bradyrhizobium sp. WD16]UTD27718.1 hypothetical protein DB459_13130 [Bradyrhizobium sp. WD16]
MTSDIRPPCFDRRRNWTSSAGLAGLMLRGKLGYGHDRIGDPAPAAAFQAPPGASFVVTRAAPARYTR